MSTVQVEGRSLWPRVLSNLMEASKYVNPRQSAEAAFFLSELLSLVDDGIRLMKNDQED